MAFIEKISVLIDVVTDRATSGLNDFKNKIGDAEGGLGKMKAAVAGAGDALSAMPLPAVAGLAVGAGVAIKGLADAFTGSALEAKKMADATGLSVTSSSEWIAAADDVGLSAETVAGGFGKATKAIGLAPQKFEDLGVAVVHARDGTVDMNATLLNAIDTIQGTEDPTKKAALASQLFGRSWAELTPLLDKGASSLRDTMAATSDAQRITDDEVASAKEWQASMDNLSDVVDNLRLSLGKLVVEGAGPALQVIGDMGNELSDLLDTADSVMGPIGGVGEIFGKWLEWASPVGLSLKVIDGGLAAIGATAAVIAGPIATVADTMGSIASTVGDAAGAVVGFVQGPFGGDSKKLWDDWGFGADNAATATNQFDTSLQTTGAQEIVFQQSSEAAQKALTDLTNAVLGSFNSQLQLHDAMQATSEKVADYTSKVQAATTAGDVSAATANTLADAQEAAARAALSEAAAAVQQATDQAAANGTTLDASQKNLILQQTLQNVADTLSPGSPLRSQLLGYVAQLSTVPEEVKTQIVADTADAVEKVNNLLALVRLFSGNVWRGIVAVGTSGVPGAATGGSRSGLTVVGEQGPELVDLPSGSFVHTADQTKSLLSGPAMPAMTLIVNNPQGSAQEWARTMLAEATWHIRTAV